MTAMRQVTPATTSIDLTVTNLVGTEIGCIQEAMSKRTLLGNGYFNGRCEEWLRDRLAVPGAFLVPSGSAALEFAVVLADIGPGDEVIMPSFTFSSTANAVAFRGAVPVFVDIRPDSLNIDETLIDAAITPRTKAIMVVHYAGVPCEMNTINAIASKHGLLVIEDAAQALTSTYYGRAAGALGDLSAFSFHVTKNIQCGEGGALTVLDPERALRAEIVREKGTNRSAFLRGEVDKYSWVDIGSSYLMNEISAAFLSAQLDAADQIMSDRLDSWDRYQAALEQLEEAGYIRRPIIPAGCRHNAHIYYVLLRPDMPRDRFIVEMRGRGVGTASHYVPLHSAVAGQRLGRTVGAMTVTDSMAGRLVRLPLWPGIGDLTDKVIQSVEDVVKALA